MNTSMKKYPLYIILVWIALGVFVSIYAYKLGMGKLSEPGAGFIPFWLGIIVAGLALFKLVKEYRGKGKGETTESQTVKGVGRSTIRQIDFYYRDPHCLCVGTGLAGIHNYHFPGNDLTASIFGVYPMGQNHCLFHNHSRNKLSNVPISRGQISRWSA